MYKSSLYLKFATKIYNKTLEENKFRDKDLQQGIIGEKKHSKEVLKWVNKLVKNPSNELQVAALFHDIDRIITPNVGSGFKGDRKSNSYLIYKKNHAKRSAKYSIRKLKKYKLSDRFLKRVEFLIVHHDENLLDVKSYKDKELEILVAADSLSWFTSTGPTIYKIEGKERAKDKLKFMINKLPKFAIKKLIRIRTKDNMINSLKDEVIKELGIK